MNSFAAPAADEEVRCGGQGVSRRSPANVIIQNLRQMRADRDQTCLEELAFIIHRVDFAGVDQHTRCSVGDDRVWLRGDLSTTLTQQYAVHVITAATGTIVREYASADDKVFAITWHGPTPPDLRTLLGDYFTPYLNASASTVQTRAGAHRQLSVSQSDLVVQAAGHARSFRGRAFVPSLIPAGVLIDALP